MKKYFEDIWREGFDAAERYCYECQYRYGSNASNVWHAGFVQGALKQNGCAYRSEPSNFELDEALNPNCIF